MSSWVQGIVLALELEGLDGRQLFAELGLDYQALQDPDARFPQDAMSRLWQRAVALSGNPAIAVALARNDHLPFASVSALAVDRDNLEQEFRRFNFAHMQHHAVVDALVNGQGARAEAIMREHANATLRYADYFDPARQGVTVLHGDVAAD